MIENSKSLLSLAFTSRLPFLSADVVHPSGSSSLKSGLPEGYSTVLAWVERAANPRAANENRRSRVCIAASYFGSSVRVKRIPFQGDATRTGKESRIRPITSPIAAMTGDDSLCTCKKSITPRTNSPPEIRRSARIQSYVGPHDNLQLSYCSVAD